MINLVKNDIVLSIFITTIGRVGLKYLLESVKDQLSINDNIYIFVDGKNNLKKVNNILKNIHFKSNLFLSCEGDILGYWGHGLRNKYQKKLNGTHILHADDDNIYLPNCIDRIKNDIVTFGFDKMLIYKLIDDFGDSVCWKNKEIKICNIDTGCGVIPNIPEKMGYWEYIYGGDFHFYESCSFKYEFIDFSIFKNNKYIGRFYDIEKINKNNKSLNLNLNDCVFVGNFSGDDLLKNVKFDTKYARYFCFESLSNIDGNDVASISKIQFLDSYDNVISNDKMNIIYADSEETRAEDGSAFNIFDDNINNYWHTQWYDSRDDFPHRIIIDFGEDIEISGFNYLPRQKGTNGRIKDYKIYLSCEEFDIL